VLNNLAGHITLPDVDAEAEVQVSQTFTTVVTNPNLPGVELTILGGTARNSDGTPFTGKLSVNPVPDYGRPESRPEELRPGMAVTIQPAGVRFNPPARITFPNADGVPPGNEFNLWSLSPDTGTFNIVGKGVVSAKAASRPAPGISRWRRVRRLVRKVPMAHVTASLLSGRNLISKMAAYSCSMSFLLIALSARVEAFP
jgi:hypothetical protein